MDEQRSDGGGTANTPPFPRLVTGTETDLSPISAATRHGPGDGGEVAHAPAGEAAAKPAIEPLEGSRRGIAEERTRPGRHTTAEVRRGGIGAFESLADRLEEAAARIADLADEQQKAALPLGGAAGTAVLSTASWLDHAADYLRTADLATIRTDVELQVRERPLRTLLIAAGTGWVLGKIMR